MGWPPAISRAAQRAAQVPALLPLHDPPRVGIHARPVADVVPVHRSRLLQWTRMAGPPDGSCRTAISSPRELLHVALGRSAGSAAHEPAVRCQLEGDTGPAGSPS